MCQYVICNQVKKNKESILRRKKKHKTQYCTKKNGINRTLRNKKEQYEKNVIHRTLETKSGRRRRFEYFSEAPIYEKFCKAVQILFDSKHPLIQIRYRDPKHAKSTMFRNNLKYHKPVFSR